MFTKLDFKSILFGVLAIMMVVSCGDETKRLDRSFFGYEYFPVEVGHTWIYKMDQTIVRSQGRDNVSNTFFLRERVTDSFINTVGDTIFVLERATSDAQNGTYIPTDVWTAELNEESAQRVEENLRFTKMIFPFRVGSTWEGNLFDGLTTVNIAEESVRVYKDWGDYEVTARDISMTVEGTEYPEVAVVDQANFESAIERRFSKEYYGSGVGLIKREMEIFDTQCICDGQDWIEKAEAGFMLTQSLVEFTE